MAYTALDAAKDILSAFKSRNSRKLRKVNDKCIINIGIEYDDTMFSLALLSYMLSKITSKPRFWKRGNIKNYLNKVEEELEKSIESYKQGDKKGIKRALSRAVKLIEQLDKRDRRYVKNLYDKSRLKVASVLYAQGFSLGRAAEITGVDKREIMDYAGNTMMFDRVETEMTLSERMKKFRKVFEE